VNPDELAALCQRIDAVNPPPEIRVCCPRGHFIAAVGIAAPKLSGPRLGFPTPAGDELLLIAADGRYHHYRSATGAWYQGITDMCSSPPKTPPKNSGFRQTFTPRGTVVTLSCRRCPRWTLVRDYQRLAVELAVYALEGHREYRLCS